MSRGSITIRVDRLEAIRILGESMRKKTQEFKTRKALWPGEFRKQRALAAGYYSRKAAALRIAKTVHEFTKLLNDGTIDFKLRRDWAGPPELNLCIEKRLLLMLQNDVRKVVPISSNHELWAILQGKCEPIND